MSKLETTEGDVMSKGRWFWTVCLLWWVGVHAPLLYSLITGEPFQIIAPIYFFSFIIIYLVCGTLLSFWLIRSRETILVVLGTLSILMLYFMIMISTFVAPEQTSFYVLIAISVGAYALITVLCYRWMHVERDLE